MSPCQCQNVSEILVIFGTNEFTEFACVCGFSGNHTPLHIKLPKSKFSKNQFFHHRQFWYVLIPSSNREFVAMLNFVSTLLNQKLLSVRDLFVNPTKLFQPVLHKIFTLYTQLMRNVKISSNVLWASLFIFNPGRNSPWVLLWKSSSSLNSEAIAWEWS